MQNSPIGIFDSGYGGLTIMKEIVKWLPQYDYLYLGDNARAPYGTRSFKTVFEYTLQAVEWLFEHHCPIIILACNTASAKALRSIQQKHLHRFGANKKILGVIRPSSETIGTLTKSNKVGVLATPGTVESNSYSIEINKFFPNITVFQHACPLWVSIIESGQHESAGAGYFFQKDVSLLLEKDKEIDVVLLGCTHYPLILDKIQKHVPPHVKLIPQGEIVAKSLVDYLQRHPEIETQLTKSASKRYFTTDDVNVFNSKAAMFYGEPIKAETATLPHT